MMQTKKLITLAGAAMLAFASFSVNAQQIKTPAPSPTAMVKQAFGLGEITVDYSRPLSRGRVIFGGVVPFGQVWRTGANSTTKITFSDDVTMEGRAVKAGTYGLYTIPGRTTWQVMLYRDLTLGGNVASYNEANEVLRVTVNAQMMANTVKSFTIGLDAVTATSATLQLMWDKTMVPVRIGTDIDSRVMKTIETAMKPGDSRPYFQAAGYYYDNNKDLRQALEWANKAIDQNNAFYVVHLKVKIQYKMKDYSGAIETAQQSMAMAREAKNDDYVRMNAKIIADAKAKR